MVMFVQSYRKGGGAGVGATLLDSDSLASDKNIGTSYTDIGMLVSVSPSAGDKFRVVGSFPIKKLSTTNVMYFRLMRNIDSAGWTQMQVTYQSMPASGTENVEIEWVDDDPGGTTVEYRVEGKCGSGTGDYQSGSTLEVYDVTDALVTFIETSTQTTGIGTTYKDLTNLTHTFTPTSGVTYRVCAGAWFQELGSGDNPKSRIVQDGSEISGTVDSKNTVYTDGYSVLRSLSTATDLGGSSTTIKEQARSGSASSSRTWYGYLIIETEA